MIFYAVSVSYDWYDLARRQRHAISLGQLSQSGVTRYQRRRLVEQGALNLAQRKVYTTGGTSHGWDTALWCAVLAAGPAALAYRGAAAAWWGMDGVMPDVVEVAVPLSRQPRLATVHRVTPLPKGDVCLHLGMPVTTVSRTLVDLGLVVPFDTLERSVEWGLRHGHTSMDGLQELVTLRSGLGARRLAAVLAARPPGAPPTESDAETLFVQIARRAGLPDPLRQHRLRLRGRLVRLDFAWPARRLAVEIDGAGVHGPDALPADLRRQNRILLDGWFILRYPWEAVAHDWARVMSELREAWEVRSLLG
jgi:very-short-patch-repair endonuclease